MKTQAPKWFLLPFLLVLPALMAHFHSSRAFLPSAWSLQPRTLTYLVQQQDFDPATGAVDQTWYDTIQLVFQQPEGQVLVRHGGAEVPSTMRPDGRIYPKDPSQPYLFWELYFLAVLPPDGDARPGKSWVTNRPTDAEAVAQDALVGQSKIQYKIHSANPLEVDFSGETRLAPSRGLNAFAQNLELSPLAIQQAVLPYKPLVRGKAIFSVAEGATLSAEGLIVPFAAFSNGEPVEKHPGRIQFRITRM